MARSKQTARKPEGGQSIVTEPEWVAGTFQTTPPTEAEATPSDEHDSSHYQQAVIPDHIRFGGKTKHGPSTGTGGRVPSKKLLRAANQLLVRRAATGGYKGVTQMEPPEGSDDYRSKLHSYDVEDVSRVSQKLQKEFDQLKEVAQIKTTAERAISHREKQAASEGDAIRLATAKRPANDKLRLEKDAQAKTATQNEQARIEREAQAKTATQNEQARIERKAQRKVGAEKEAQPDEQAQIERKAQRKAETDDGGRKSKPGYGLDGELLALWGETHWKTIRTMVRAQIVTSELVLDQQCVSSIISSIQRVRGDLTKFYFLLDDTPIQVETTLTYKDFVRAYLLMAAFNCSDILSFLVEREQIKPICKRVKELCPECGENNGLHFFCDSLELFNTIHIVETYLNARKQNPGATITLPNKQIWQVLKTLVLSTLNYCDRGLSEDESTFTGRVHWPEILLSITQLASDLRYIVLESLNTTSPYICGLLRPHLNELDWCLGMLQEIDEGGDDDYKTDIEVCLKASSRNISCY
jgi:hypothetical protein